MTEVLGDEFKQTAAKQIPLGRVGSPADVASAVAFLARTKPPTLLAMC
jgi:NAD(P)-dependent dehydrogenase (short-subunit alcohol dehydrogenase family)